MLELIKHGWWRFWKTAIEHGKLMKSEIGLFNYETLYLYLSIGALDRKPTPSHAFSRLRIGLNWLWYTAEYHGALMRCPLALVPYCKYNFWWGLSLNRHDLHDLNN